MKKIAILPTLLTLGNAVCGFAAILTTSKIIPEDSQTHPYFAQAAWLILAAMIFDALDGYAARLSKTASDFGGQLDSLCDAISFGVAPAFLVLRMAHNPEASLLVRQGILGIAVLYMCCTILRLARFNTENSPDPAAHKRFKGLPSPAAAGCVASMAILQGALTKVFSVEESLVLGWMKVLAPLGTLVVGLLMVSRFAYPHMTKQILRGRRHFSHLVEVILLVGLVLLTREITLAILFWGYALLLPLRSIAERAWQGRRVRPAPLDEVVPH